MWAHAAMTAPPAQLQAALAGPAPCRPAPSLPWIALIPGAPLRVTSAATAAAARNLTGSCFPLSPPFLDLFRKSNSFIAETINCRDLIWSDGFWFRLPRRIVGRPASCDLTGRGLRVRRRTGCCAPAAAAAATSSGQWWC